MDTKIITRALEKTIINSLSPGHVIGLLGARRVGKTVLLNTIKNKLSDRKILVVQGDNLEVSEILSGKQKSLLERLVQGYDTLFIDEAQMISEIGAI